MVHINGFPHIALLLNTEKLFHSVTILFVKHYCYEYGAFIIIIPHGNQYCLLFALNCQFIVSPNSLIRVKLAQENLMHEGQEKSNLSQPVFVFV